MVTVFGEVEFNKTYFKSKKKREYKYLVDEKLCLEPHQKIDLSLQAEMIDMSTENPYKTTGKRVVNGVEISDQTVMNNIRNLEALDNRYMDDFSQKREVPILYVEYQYDVNGLRVLSTAGDVTTHYFYNFSQSVIYEKDSDTNQAEQEVNIEEERYYIFSHNKIMAEVKGNAESGVEVYYYHQDNLGSTRMMTSGYGIVVMEQDYLPFGDDLRISGSVDGDGLTGYKYTGQGTTGVGLLYYKARYYGRFTREDEYREEIFTPQSQATESLCEYWDDVIEFNGNKVYRRNDLFDPNTISSWKVKGKTVTGTNIERMASGRAPIGHDGKSINFHHLTQTQSGAIAEVSRSFHQSNYSTIHINTGKLPFGINRAEFDIWKKGYWRNRAKDFLD